MASPPKYRHRRHWKVAIDDEGRPASRRVFAPDPTTLRVDHDLYSGYVIANRPAPGLASVRPTDAPPVSQFTALRNFLYALEWWVFGLFALAVWVRWCRDTLGRLDEDRPVPSST